ncbi:4-hydroxythreonine-4-phosphate dehydrogenase [Mesotoga sp. Brook.08.105.5.1]|uniref:4-hydroxythreonine-4-phosphate dehydrogenase PdxA n=1 Tax=Mesotoga sp. Brook.08.105.5.1 TaxID=1421002 RepID=UPI000C17E57C|nr:4-hydroxythreonine-4-phosphate dehydrogenase PdxA [Mesotoga sp. Brook.08.105.5.1]PVD17536.1 4-hydroxythreonine-4-phosphate dehydrogenase [Mesotoga sp. Brook.08.105.5.1]
MLLKPMEKPVLPERLSGKPLIAITIGDPAGIGPEIVCKAIAHGEILEICRPVVIGDRKIIQREIYRNKLSLDITLVEGLNEEMESTSGNISLIDMGNADVLPDYGKICGGCGRAAYEYLEKAAELAQKGKISAITTAPINKMSIKAAGVPFAGHTEILGSLLGARDPLTMFEIAGELRVFFLSRHVSLMEACRMVKRDRIFDYIVRCDAALKQLDIEQRRPIGVAALNPHGGEGGLFGREELDEIIPAVELARQKGIDVLGPIGADSIFSMARRGAFSAVLSMYHDQGHIATKTLDFDRTVSITLGMPILRTSVDHGTAFDIAGRGIADPTNLIEAVKAAARYS